MSVKHLFKSKRNCILAMTMALAMMFTCMGCGVQKTDGKSLREQGMDIIQVMEEMVKSEDYGNLMSNSADLAEIRRQLAAGDYTSPAAVYEMSVPSIWSILALAGESEDSYDFSNALKKQLDSKSASALASQLNAMKGTAALAGTSLYTAGKTFVSDELTENIIYLYTFQNGYPIAVAFTAGEDHAVTAQGTFILWEDIEGESMEFLRNLLKEFGISDTLRQLPETP